MTRSRTRTRALAAVLATVALVGACGGDDSSGDSTDVDSTGTETTLDETTSAAPTTEAPATTPAPDTTAPDTTAPTTSEPATTDQLAIWPAADVVFTTPEEAAADFVENALGVPAELGDFMQGDERSGEIEVFSPGEGGAATRVVRSLLLMRQLGEGWFVLAAVSDGASITSPEAYGEITPGPLAVEGMGRGFEALLVVTAFLAGDAANELAEQTTMGGSMETPEPFAVELDLSSTSPGDVVTLLVRGGVGLETDPGEFAAIPVVVAS